MAAARSTQEARRNREEILAKRNEGETIDAIARAFDIHPKTLQSLLREWTSDESRKRMRINGGATSARIKIFRKAVASGEVATLREAGWSLEAIAKRFAVTTQRVVEELEAFYAMESVQLAERLVEGEKYGKFIYIGTSGTGRCLKHVFRHECGYKVTFIPPQLRDWRMEGAV